MLELESELNMLKFQPNFQVIGNLVHSGIGGDFQVTRVKRGRDEGQGEGSISTETLVLILLIPVTFSLSECIMYSLNI